MSRLDIIDIPNGYELRVQLAYGQEAIVELLEGRIAYCGWFLKTQKPIVFKDQPFGLTAFGHAKLKIRTHDTPYYVAQFFVPEITKGDRSVVLITGIKGSGKTTLAKWILNTHCVTGDRSIYINLDPGQAPFCPPGCLSAMEISKPITNKGFPSVDPLIYFFGSTEIREESLELYRDQILLLQAAVLEKEAQSSKLGLGPINCIVIDLPLIPNIDGALEEISKLVCDAFHVTKIFAVGDENLKRVLPKSPMIKLLNYPVIPGAVYIDEETKSKLFASQILQYFYGTKEKPLTPVVATFPRSQFNLWSFGPLSYISSIMLPVGMDKTNPKVLSFVGLSSLLNRRLIAVVGNAEQDVWKQNVLGFYLVLNIGDSKSTENDSVVELLAPNAIPLPPHKRIASTIELDRSIELPLPKSDS